MRAYFQNIAGVETRYLKAGSGEHVLLVHGVGMNADSWYRVIPPLSRDFTVIAPDLLDNGFTGAGNYKSGAPHDYILDHLTALLDALDVQRFHLVGSSFGALISVLLYLRMPHRVSRLTVVGSGSLMYEPEELMTIYEQSYRNGRSVLENPTLEQCKQRLSNIFCDANAIPHEFLLLQLTPYALPSALTSYERRLNGMRDLESIRRYQVVHRFSEIKVPTLVVWGKQDRRSDFSVVQRHIDKIPDVRLVAIDQCGHLPHVEQSEVFVRTVRDFLMDDLTDNTGSIKQEMYSQ